MQLVKNAKTYSRLNVHIAGEDGRTLCGRLVLTKTEPTDSKLTCTWCLSRQRHGADPMHRAVMICAECGALWPCDHWADEHEDRCMATTAAGRPCRRKRAYGTFCRMHDKVIEAGQ